MYVCLCVLEKYYIIKENEKKNSEKPIEKLFY